MPGRAGPTLCRRPGMIRVERTVLSAPGTVVVVEHIAPLVPVHIVAPGRQFEKQGRKPGSFVVQAEAGADRYVAMGMPRQ